MRLLAKSLLVLSALIITRVVGAQTPADVIATERATAVYTASHYATGRVLFDTTGFSSLGGAALGGRSALENAALASLAHASTVGRRLDYRACTSGANAECDVPGFDVVLSISRPLVQGDTAFVDVKRFFHAGRPQMSSATYRLRLVKRNSAWVVDDVKSLSVS